MLELLLVLVVVTLLAAIAFPILAGSYDRYKLSEQVEVARVQLARARLYAVDTGVAYQFRYEPGGQNFIVVPFEVDSDIQENGEATGEGGAISDRYPLVSMKLPKGYTFEHDPEAAAQQPKSNQVVGVPSMIMDALPDARGLTGTSWSPPIVFRPEGEAEATVFSFIVKDEQKRFIRLTVRPLTGAISVGKVEQGR